MKGHKISIITPSFNQAAYIEQTIDSVLSQRYDHLEYIIIDGGSTDGTVQIIKRYEKYITYWESNRDRGQSHAINKGVAKATGEVINWLNSDDYLQPDSLRIISECFNDPKMHVLIGRSNIIQDGTVIRITNGTDVYAGNLAKTLGWARIDQPETFFRRNIITCIGPVNESLHYTMDKEFWIRYLLKYGLGNVYKIDAVLANFRLHDQSKTQRLREEFQTDTNTLFYQLAMQNELEDEAKIIQEHFDIKTVELPALKTSNIHLVKCALHYFFLYKADELYYQNYTEQARKVIRKIASDVLDESDAALLKRLSFRSKCPSWVIKMLRAWRSA